jgi:hypothetical protein
MPGGSTEGLGILAPLRARSNLSVKHRGVE